MSLVFACLLIPAFYAYQNKQVDDLQTKMVEVAAMISQQVTMALQLKDKEEAMRLMQGLRHIELIHYAELRDDKGYLFAVFQDPQNPLIRPRYLEMTQKAHFWIQRQQLNLNYPIGYESKQHGQLYIQIRLDGIYSHSQEFIYFAVAISVLLQLIFLPLWGAIFRWQLHPIQRLLALFEQIKQTGDSHLRPTGKTHNYELQTLQQAVHNLLNNYDVLQDKLDYAETQTSAANIAKSQFLLTISNEIRSPMNGVLGITEVLLDTKLDSQQQELGQIIHDSGTRLLSILNDISEYSKLEAGQLSLYISQFNLSNLLKNLVDEFAPQAQQKNIHFHVLMRDELPSLVRGDESRLQRILHNHLANAIKFTHKGEVNFQIYISHETDEFLELGFSIRDTGVGIDKKTLAHLFEVFPEASSTERKYGGTGLPLVINKKLCQMMGGDIHCHSISGEGTTFQISVKLEKVDSDTSQPHSGQSLQGLNILLLLPIAETQVLQHYLKKWSVNVEVLSKKEGIEKRLKVVIAQQKHHICIYNANMVSQLSQTLQDIITQDALTPVFSFIQLQYQTKNNSQETQSLSYPLFPNQLYRSVKRLYLKNREETLWYSLTQSKHLQSKQAYRDHHVLLVESNPINQQVAKLYLNKLSCSVDVVESGADALACLNEEHPYDLLLINCKLVKDDEGLSTTRKIRRKEKQHNPEEPLPIIALIAHANSQEQQRCLDAGANDWLNKPFNKTQLQQILDKWL